MLIDLCIKVFSCSMNVPWFPLAYVARGKEDIKCDNRKKEGKDIEGEEENKRKKKYQCCDVGFENNWITKTQI